MTVSTVQETHGSAAPLVVGMRVRLLEHVGWIAVKGGVPAGAVGTVRRAVVESTVATTLALVLRYIDGEPEDGAEVVWMVDFDKHKPRRAGIVCALDHFATGGKLPAYLAPL